MSVGVRSFVEWLWLVVIHSVGRSGLIRVQVVLRMPARAVKQLVAIVVATSVILVVFTRIQPHLLVELLLTDSETRIGSRVSLLSRVSIAHSFSPFLSV